MPAGPRLTSGSSSAACRAISAAAGSGGSTGSASEDLGQTRRKSPPGPNTHNGALDISSPFRTTRRAAPWAFRGHANTAPCPAAYHRRLTQRVTNYPARRIRPSSTGPARPRLHRSEATAANPALAYAAATFSGSVRTLDYPNIARTSSPSSVFFASIPAAGPAAEPCRRAPDRTSGADLPPKPNICGFEGLRTPGMA